MTTVSELQELVAMRYAELGLPSWPDPHPEMEPPRDEEYSRVTDPGRYRIVHARARVWTRVLEDALGVQVEACAPGPAGSAAFDRGVRLVPPDGEALPLLLLEREVPVDSGLGTLAISNIAVVRADVVVESQPDCGCDACDSGSSDLLEALDAAIRRVVSGPFVALRGKGWHADWHPDGGSSGGAGRGPDHSVVMDLCGRLAAGERVRLPRGAEAFVGRGWAD